MSPLNHMLSFFCNLGHWYSSRKSVTGSRQRLDPAADHINAQFTADNHNQIRITQYRKIHIISVLIVAKGTFQLCALPAYLTISVQAAIQKTVHLFMGQQFCYILPHVFPFSQRTDVLRNIRELNDPLIYIFSYQRSPDTDLQGAVLQSVAVNISLRVPLASYF